MKIPFASSSDRPEVSPDEPGGDGYAAPSHRYDLHHGDELRYPAEPDYGDEFTYADEPRYANRPEDFDEPGAGRRSPLLDEDDYGEGVGYENEDSYGDEGDESDVGPRRGGPSRLRWLGGAGGGSRGGAATVTVDDEPVSADEFLGEMEQWRAEASAEQRSAWAYLGLLTVVFGSLVVFGYGCSDQRGDGSVTDGQGVMLASGEPTHLVFRVDGDIIALQGEVPDEAAKGQLVAGAQESYGTENVIDELVVNPETTFENGTIRLIGSAAFEDGRPQSLQEAVSAAFGLANRGFEVGFVDTVLAPVSAQVTIEDGRAVLSGALPDQQSIDDLFATAAEVWGADGVDASALTIGSTTWTDGVIRMTGTALSNDQRVGSFVALVPDRIGTLVTVDTAGLSINDISELLETVQVAIDELVLADPIKFAPLSADIDPSSDATLVEVASLVGQLPTTPFEVVGHTDSIGDDQENLLLSEDRAKAVVARLVELGVGAERMTARGEGETKPIADNGTDAGRSANRRIEIILVGTSGTLDTSGTDG